MNKVVPQFENVAMNRQERRKRRMLIIAALGLTKAGKTSFITSLVKKLEKIISLFLGDMNRTKVTVDYHFVSSLASKEEDLMIEDIQFRISAISKSSVEQFNNEVQKNPIYKILKLQAINENEAFEEKLLEMLDHFQEGITPKDLAKILNTEGIDEYIKKITVLVEATDALASVLDNLEIDLYMRDTRGLMDLALQEQEDGTKITNIRSLNDLGLDGLSGVLFFCSRDGYTNNILQIYEDTLKNVFKSVPIFLVRRSEILPLACKILGAPNNVEETIEFTQTMQNGENHFFPSYELDNFQTTLKLLNDLNITYLKQTQYVFRDLYFDQNRMEFLVPDSASLTSASTVNNVIFDVSSEDYNLFQLFSMACMSQVLEMINELHKFMERLVSDGITKYIQSNKQYIINLITQDLKKYDLIGIDTEIVRPQLEAYSSKNLCDLIVDSNYEVLGPRGGITTPRNGVLRYASTAVLAVSSKRAIDHLIEKVSEINNITSSLNNISLDKQLSLIKKALNFILYRNFVDIYATVQNYVIVPRGSAKKAIYSTRELGVPTSIPLETAVSFILDEFCNILESSDVRRLFTN
ncbi:hypothetical protein [Paenibacillus polymyxa]|uniref:hypothetical protein n=1 Tax=Paenibacillus polymyxa TaxID=1406 RepID=UPI000C9FCD73|nr:hypothetical protein [Paenibacillus polymyxa]PNQ84226.1 hypothetical protein C1T20_19920 [Paenibacillus polymyxa]QDA28236.1 hypothetical protein FGY93_15520 [Paenibacillus polymyxa]RTZ37201.1 hypothetical protein EJ573_04695 [Paenibacillus polymyxa]